MSGGNFEQLKNAIKGLYHVIDMLSVVSSKDESYNVSENINEDDISSVCKVDEQLVMEQYGTALREVTNIRDSYITESCDICEQLRKNLVSLKSFTDSSRFDSHKIDDIIDLLYQHTTKYEDVDSFLATTFICKYCADKLKGNKEIARSAFNSLSVVPVPLCITDLKLFEKQLIKFTMTCLTKVRFGQVTNNKRSSNELMTALKGRIAYLPVDVSANAKFLPENLLNVDSLVLLVGGQPTKCQKIWTSVVNLKKVHTALTWLRSNNHLYKNVPSYTFEDIQSLINNRLQTEADSASSATPDKALLKKLDEASISYLYEHFTTQPLSGDFPADSLIDYQINKQTGQSLNVFDTDLDTQAYPELFPTGVNGMKEAKRTIKIGTSDFIKSRLLNKNPRFRLNINYLFHLFQVQEVSNMCHSVGHMLRTVTGNTLSAKALQERLTNKDGEIQSKMFSLMANIRGTKEYFAKLSMDLKWMLRQLGSPTLFITCSTAEWSSKPFIDYLIKVN
jgi:hypothetical protein